MRYMWSGGDLQWQRNLLTKQFNLYKVSSEL